MNILTLENKAFEMNEIPDEIDDLRFCVLDNSNPADADYFFIPLIFLESFNAPAVVLTIGNHQVKMPIDWQIVVADEEFGDCEVIPLEDVNDRGFTAFIYNALNEGRPDYLEIEITDIYQDVKWYFPKLKPGQILCVPIESGEKPRCAYFVKDISRQCEIIDFCQVW